MDRSGVVGTEGDEVMVVGTGENPGVGVEVHAKRVTRRCVQQKLKFGGSPGGGREGSEESDGERKGKRKRKGNARPAAVKKVSPIKKDISGSDKVSKSSKKLKIHNGDSSPLKDMSSSLKRACSRRSLANDKSPHLKISGPETMNTCQPVVDLWSEARTAAEENQRLFAGRQIHPFFSCRKVMKGSFEALEMDKIQNKCDTVLKEFFPPLHVTDTLEDNSSPLDWSKWSFNDKDIPSFDSNSAEMPFLLNYENYAVPLKVDSVSVRHSLETFSPRREISLLDEVADSKPEVTQSCPSNREMADGQSMITINSSKDLLTKCDISANNPREMQDKQLERSMPNQYSHGSCSDHNLWTNKYQPEMASEVCGNTKAVNFINEWLKCWRESGLQTCDSSAAGNKTMTIDVSDSSSSRSESNTEIEDECSQLRNVLLVTGPVGSGKSAAIFACAKEQGFEVIEVNASDQRNGALIKQKFGEAVESHGLDLRSNLEIKTSVYEVLSKSLILFEDVDTVFDEDRGFIGMILQLAETSKRPMILTTNCKDPVLPQVLEREVVEFMLPSHEELLSHVSMICAAEGSHCSSSLLKKLIKLCQSDIRKTITLLQFWCQGKSELGSNEYICSPLEFDLDAAHVALSELVPWGFPCKLSERVAMEIAKTRYSVSVKENEFFLNVVKQQEYELMEHVNSSHVNGNEATTIANKDAMAKCPSFIDCNGYSLKDNDQLSDISESPLKFTLRTGRQQCSTVVSSDLDDEQENEFPNRHGSLDFNNDLSPDVSLVPASQLIDHNNHSDLNDKLMDHSTKHDSCQPSLWNLETSNPSDMFGMYKSLDASCIPESNLVPGLGTESDHEADFFPSALPSNNFCVASGEALVNKDMPIYELSETGHDSLHNNKIEFKTPLFNRVENSPLLHEESVHGNEDPQDLDCGKAHFLTRDWQLMDECSRADFSLGISKDINNCSELAGEVLDIWKRLRNQHDDLKSYLSSDKEVASQTLKYCSRMTSLISDTDIMLSGCESLICDCIEPILVPYIEPASISWCDERLEIASTFAQYGLSLFSNKSKKLGSEMGKEISGTLAQKMLVVSNSPMALGRLLSQENTTSEEWYTDKTLLTGMPNCDISLIRETESKMYDAMLPLVPERLCMAIRGHAFREYSSFVSLILKTEDARLISNIEDQHRRRRTRAPPHYLKSCPIALSSEDVTLLAQHCCFGSTRFG